MDERQNVIHIERPIYDNDKLRRDFCYERSEKKLCPDCKDLRVKSVISNAIPSIGWLSHYRWKEWFIPDLIGGLTVAIMHIPQGMAYALLGNVPPITGLYMAFFPVIIYFFLGTSRHISMGTMAIVCLMTGKTVIDHSDPYYFEEDSKLLNSTVNTDIGYSPLQVVSVVCFSVGAVQLAMWVLRLGAISVLLSQTLVSGFTTGAAVQVVVSQLRDLLGLQFARPSGYFTIIKTVQKLINKIENTNYAALVISAICILVVGVNNELLKPAVANRCSFPIPIEMIVVLIGSVVSRYLQLEENYSVITVGEIPRGLPEISIPQFDLIPSVLVDAFSIALVAFSISLSMGLIFAQKNNYELDSNQELFAQACGNIFGSFFSCIPFCASLSRSMIQASIGKTQVTSLISCGILLIIMMWIGPFFTPLPKAALASIIIVSLKGMLMQMQDLYDFWKLSRMDALVWLTTFLTVVFVAIDIGLLVGAIMSLVTIFVFSFKPHTCLLGLVPHTDLYLDINTYQGTKEIPGVKIFHYSGGLNFATRNIFRFELLQKIDFNPQREQMYRNKIMRLSDKISESGRIENQNSTKYLNLKKKINSDLKCLILDFSALSHIDPSGVLMLHSVIENFSKIDISVYIVARSDPVYNMIQKCGLYKKQNVKIYPTIQDAVKCAIDIFHIDLNSIFI